MVEKDNSAISKKEHLAMIQEPIGRMSTASSVFKGFSATIVSGLAVLSNDGIKIVILVLSFLPVLSFAALDIYYLRKEKMYRGLYNDVLNNLHPIDFSMTIPKEKAFEMRAEASFLNCIKSPSILLFYPTMLLVLGAICTLTAKGVI